MNGREIYSGKIKAEVSVKNGLLKSFSNYVERGTVGQIGN